MEVEALTIEGVVFGYSRAEPVIQGLSAKLRRGVVTVLIGPNAAGKSTLLRLILGQLRPWSGGVFLDGRPVGAVPPLRRARFMSYVPQRSSAHFGFTVEEVVRMGRYALGPDEAAVDRALEQCDLKPVRHRIFAHLSAGQQQRVLLARALAQSYPEGQFMLLDEPGNAMDLLHTHQTMELLREQATRGLGVLVVLHDLNLAARYGDEVWLLERGRLRAAGSWSEVMQKTVLEPVYGVRLESLILPGLERPMFAVQGERP